MGTNMQDAPNLLQPTEARRMENGELDERGGFTKRLGCMNMGTIGVAADRIISIYTFYRGSNPPQFLAHTTAGKIYQTLDPTANPIVWTQIGTGYSTTQPISWETFNSKVYFCDGVSFYSSWDGTTLVTYASPPRGKYLRLWKDTMWVSGVSGLDDRVFASAAGDAETYPVANWVDIKHGDGDSVKALATDGVYLIVGKRNTGTIIYDPALFSNRVFDYEKGIESHFSVIQHESNIFYLTRRGIAEWQGDSPANIISYKIDPLFDPHILNYQALDKTWAYSYGNKVGWAIAETGSASPTMQINYYPRLAELSPLGVRGLGPWSFDRMPITCASLWRSGNILRLFGGAAAANKCYWMFADAVGQDDGVSYQALLEGPVYDFGERLNTKYLRRLRILGRGRFNMQLKRNFESATYKTFPIDLTSSADTWNPAKTWGTGTWGPDSNVKETTVDPDAYGRAFQLVFADAPESTPGTTTVPVGSRDYALSSGEWSILGCTLDGFLLGVRNN